MVPHPSLHISLSGLEHAGKKTLDRRRNEFSLFHLVPDLSKDMRIMPSLKDHQALSSKVPAELEKP